MTKKYLAAVGREGGSNQCRIVVNSERNCLSYFLRFRREHLKMHLEKLQPEVIRLKKLLKSFLNNNTILENIKY